MKQMLIYDGVTPLAKDKHLNYSIKPIPGYDFARGTNSVPVMAVTAYAGKGDEGRVRQAGADAYVSKPISVSRFVSAVEGLAGPLGDGFKRAG